MLPAPSPDALAHSQALCTQLREQILDAGGWISFADYMEAVLYTPGQGYYAAGATKFGAAGDFVTAPELTPLFGRALAHAIAPVLRETGGDVLELGAGSGALAADVLLELEQLSVLPTRYCILDVSADLAARQRATLAQRAPHLLARVAWLDGLPDSFSGVIFGNEVLDALPVEVVHWTASGAQQRGVAVVDEQFVWHDRAIADPELHARASALALPPGYISEIGMTASSLVSTLAEGLDSGLILLIDYGFSQREFYHPQRHMGTLRAHYRHHALDDPFYLPGLCDLTAHVDFSAIAAAAIAGGLTCASFTTQANFLIGAGIGDLLMQTAPTEAAVYLPQANALQRLVSPAEMGELFKVIALTRGLASTPFAALRQTPL